MGALATTTAERFRAICDRRHTTLKTSVTGAVGPVIRAPAEWIAQLLSVLLDNAIRHSPEGSTVAVVVFGDQGSVELTVEDNGPGIPLEQRARVLDRFHRASNSHEGAGLGLAIADAIVRSTSGRWDIGDAVGGGARMSVRWQRSSEKAFEAESDEQVAAGQSQVESDQSVGVTTRP